MPGDDIKTRLKQIDQLMAECQKIADTEGLIFEASLVGASNTYVGKTAQPKWVDEDGNPVEVDDPDAAEEEGLEKQFIDIDGEQVYDEYGELGYTAGGWLKSFC